MARFGNFDASEKEALDRILEGLRVSSLPSRLVDQLIKKHVLEEIEDSFIVPALVWDQWRIFKAETGWTQSELSDAEFILSLENAMLAAVKPTFGKINQSLRPNDRVVIGNTTSAELDGATGEIIGVSTDGDPYATAYIILLDKPLENGWRGVSIIESCLDRAL